MSQYNPLPQERQNLLKSTIPEDLTNGKVAGAFLECRLNDLEIQRRLEKDPRNYYSEDDSITRPYQPLDYQRFLVNLLAANEGANPVVI